jgi:hypothetical protein
MNETHPNRKSQKGRGTGEAATMRRYYRLGGSNGRSRLLLLHYVCTSWLSSGDVSMLHLSCRVCASSRHLSGTSQIEETDHLDHRAGEGAMLSIPSSLGPSQRKVTHTISKLGAMTTKKTPVNVRQVPKMPSGVVQAGNNQPKRLSVYRSQPKGP